MVGSTIFLQRCYATQFLLAIVQLFATKNLFENSIKSYKYVFWIILSLFEEVESSLEVYSDHFLQA